MAKKEKQKFDFGQRLLDADQTAKYMNVGKQSLYNSRARNSKNKFPVEGKKVGGRVLWDKRDLDAYIDNM